METVAKKNFTKTEFRLGQFLSSTLQGEIRLAVNVSNNEEVIVKTTRKNLHSTKKISTRT